MNRKAASSSRLPKGWEDVWAHCQRAVEKFEDHSERRHSHIFTFTREMMRYPWPDDWRKDPERIADLIESMYSHQNNELARMMNREPGLETFWEYHFPEIDGREEFLSIWCGTRFSPHTDPITQARDDADKLELSPSKPSMRIYRRLLSIAGHLQRRVGDSDIVLPQERLGLALRVSQRAVSGYLQGAQNDGYLLKVGNHSHAGKLAARYRFDLTRWNWKSGKEI